MHHSSEQSGRKFFYSHGKLLISSEYVILDGAESLAVPTLKGQNLKVFEEVGSRRRIYWKSLNHRDETWFECYLDHNFNILTTTDSAVAATLQKWLLTAANLNPMWLIDTGDIQVITQLEFPENWGLGSSSTLLSCIARWAEVDPYHLLWEAFSGSGYDIACATADKPIIYQLQQASPKAQPVDWNPKFKDDIYFIHLDKKQRSAKEVVRYRELDINRKEAVQWFSKHNRKLLQLDTLEGFEEWCTEHENQLSNLLQLQSAREKFADFNGAVKSLGAWGGDFILAAGQEAPDYFKRKGLHTVLNYREMVLA